jgi:hypothetical protein
MIYCFSQYLDQSDQAIQMLIYFINLALLCYENDSIIVIVKFILLRGLLKSFHSGKQRMNHSAFFLQHYKPPLGLNALIFSGLTGAMGFSNTLRLTEESHSLILRHSAAIMGTTCGLSAVMMPSACAIAPVLRTDTTSHPSASMASHIAGS